MNIIALYGSSRRQGNTEILTDTVLQGVASSKVYLLEHHLLPIDDKRHHPDGFSPLNDDYQSLIEHVMQHDIILFSTPIYWYGMSGLMKNFVDRWSQSLRDKTLEFKTEMRMKKAYVVAVGGDQPRTKGLPMLQQFHYIFDFVGMEFCGYVLGEGNKPGDIHQDELALFEAARLNRHFLSMQQSTAP
jgi:multimeric flavodoxin WrbA